MSDQNKPQSVLAQMQADYKEKLSNGLQSHEMETMQGVTVYWKQENMAQRSRYYSGLLNREIEAFVDVVVHRALNAQGVRMFKPQDRDMLLKTVDPDVIMEMSNAILGSSEDDTGADKEFEEAAKN